MRRGALTLQFAGKLEMPVKLLSESMDATITDADQARIEAILSFWFKEQELSAPQIDRRMDIWFSEDAVFDHEIVSVAQTSFLLCFG